jgi:hypothetical protein
LAKPNYKPAEVVKINSFTPILAGARLLAAQNGRKGGRGDVQTNEGKDFSGALSKVAAAQHTLVAPHRENPVLQ